MSMFGKLFGDSNSKDNPSSDMDWNDLTDLKQLDEIIDESADTPVIIFKHSTRCSISRMALKTFEREYNIEEGSAKPYFLDLLEHRDISNEIALRFEVVHQSPQLILIKNGKAVYTTSHSDIDAVELKNRVTA
ncbi:bacillithiol system redox-active protein YtxJ [Flavobacterium hauense]